MRAHFFDNLSLQEVAERFGYRIGTYRNLCNAFRKDPDRPFFGTRKPGPRRRAGLPGHAERRNRSGTLAGIRAPALHMVSAEDARQLGRDEEFRRERASAMLEPVAHREVCRPAADGAFLHRRARVSRLTIAPRRIWKVVLPVSLGGLRPAASPPT